MKNNREKTNTKVENANEFSHENRCMKLKKRKLGRRYQITSRISRKRASKGGGRRAMQTYAGPFLAVE